MAIEYTLYLDTSYTPDRIRSAVLACCVDDDLDESLPGRMSFTGEHLQVAVVAVDDTSRRFIREDFSFDADLRVAFRLDKFELEDAQGALCRCLGEILRAGEGDVMLLFNHDLVVLQRVDRDLILRRGFGLWAKQTLDLLGVPHRIGPLEDPA